VKLVLFLEEVSGNSKRNCVVVPKRFDFVLHATRDSSGKIVFSNKGSVGLPLLGWLLDNGCFPFGSPLTISKFATIFNFLLRYDMERYGVSSDVEAVCGENGELSLKFNGRGVGGEA
jgi:hypothetical protein